MHLLQTTANPAPSRYQWRFVSSADVEREERLVEGEGRRLTWVVEEEEQYGKLVCWAENSSEGVPEPCSFLVTPAVKPGLLTSCKMINRTWDSLHISCRPSHQDLSPDQYKYLALLTDTATNHTKMISFPRPEFLLTQLDPGTQYSVSLFAENKLGAGPAITLLAHTVRLAEKRTAESKIALEEVSEEGESEVMMVIIGVTCGVVIVVTCLLTSSFLLLGSRRRRSQSQETNSLGTAHSSLAVEIESELSTLSARSSS